MIIIMFFINKFNNSKNKYIVEFNKKENIFFIREKTNDKKKKGEILKTLKIKKSILLEQFDVIKKIKIEILKLRFSNYIDLINYNLKINSLKYFQNDILGNTVLGNVIISFEKENVIAKYIFKRKQKKIVLFSIFELKFDIWNDKMDYLKVKRMRLDRIILKILKKEENEEKSILTKERKEIQSKMNEKVKIGNKVLTNKEFEEEFSYLCEESDLDF